MKIKDIRIIPSWAGLRNWVMVKVETDTEIYGWGEATLEGREEAVIAALRRLSGMLVGQDALGVEQVWQQLYRHGFWRGGPVQNTALSAIDQALWDIRGKAWGVPVYRLLGGPARQRIRLYTHVGISILWTCFDIRVPSSQVGVFNDQIKDTFPRKTAHGSGAQNTPRLGGVQVPASLH